MTQLRNALLLVVVGALACYAVWLLLQPMLPYLLVLLFLVLVLGVVIKAVFR